MPLSHHVAAAAPPAPAASGQTPLSKPRLSVSFDPSCGTTLRSVLMEAPALFVEADAASADVIVFGSDEIAYLRNNALLKSFRSKSVCVTETDIPTFYLPGLYAANAKSVLTAGRTDTISYFISQRDRGNAEVARLAGASHAKSYLYSFMGGSNSWARKRLFRSVRSRSDTLIEPTDSYNHWEIGGLNAQAKANQVRRYAEVMAASKFVLCPRGCGLSSYRLFESMSLGVAPVIISDAWRPVAGIDWSFAIFIRERDIPRLDAIVRSREGEWQARGCDARSAFERYFANEAVAGLVHGSLSNLLAAYDPRWEAIMAPATSLRAVGRSAYWKAYLGAKYSVLWLSHVTGRPIPVTLNRPVAVQLNRKP